ncbi:MAG TPA: LytTR family DNA-binding domain-containing protein [Gemmatimonadaceae bacterium]|nr:LytTR family DNA-binding domain-containing protein [Gemmatimonadaceae bacterium]
MSRVIRTVVVDDEPLAREGLRVRLGREDDVEIVGEAADGPSAVDAILSLRPDLVFLDVQIPGFDGFDVVARTASSHLPTIVFVTAYDRYALRAFEVHALDYLLKPIAHRRFQEALRRARHELERRERDGTATEDASGDAESLTVVVDRLRRLLDDRDSSAVPRPATLTDAPRYSLRFTVRDGERYVLLRVGDVDWAEASANYVRLHVGAKTFQMRTTMSDLERQLDPAQFRRIHRSTIVNLDRVREIRPEWHGEYEVALTTGATLRLSRGYRDRLI